MYFSYCSLYSLTLVLVMIKSSQVTTNSFFPHSHALTRRMALFNGTVLPWFVLFCVPWWELKLSTLGHHHGTFIISFVGKYDALQEWMCHYCKYLLQYWNVFTDKLHIHIHKEWAGYYGSGNVFELHIHRYNIRVYGTAYFILMIWFCHGKREMSLLG